MEHFIDSIPVIISDKKISSFDSMEATSCLRLTFSEDSASIVSLDQILAGGVSDIDRKNINAIRKALLNGQLDEHRGKYAIVNNGDVQYGEICNYVEETIGRYSSQYAMVFRVPMDPNRQQAPEFY